MTSETPEQLVDRLRKRFTGLPDNDLQALIIAIWLAGTMQQLACLGVIGGGKMKEMDGLDQWAEIDKHRYRLIPPNLLGHCLITFTEVAAIEELRPQPSELLAMYYTDTGRREITAKSLNRIFTNSPSK